MKRIEMDYGVVFMTAEGGSFTVSNFDLSIGSCNPYGLGGDYRCKDLDHMKSELDKYVWITEQEKKVIKAEMDRVYPMVLEKIDKKPVKVTYQWNDYQGKYAVKFFNKGGHQISNADFYNAEGLKYKLDHVRRVYPDLPIVEIK